jgi:hypothetical protein
MLTEDEQVRVTLRMAVDPVRSSPTLLPEVHRRIRRTTVNRRIRRVTGAGLTIGVLAVTVVVLRPGHVAQAPAANSPLPAAYQAVLDRPTGGDLAATEQPRMVLSTYATWVTGPASMTYQDGPGGRLAGEPAVAWVGTTPAGFAAITVQELQPPSVTFTQSQPSAAGVYVTYLDRSTAGEWQVAADGTIGFGFDDLGAAVIGPDSTVLFALDTGRPMEYATTATITPTGFTERSYRDVRFSDGAAVIPLPAGTELDEVAVQTKDRSVNTFVTHRAGTAPGKPNTMLPWRGSYQLTPGIMAPPVDVLLTRFENALRLAGYADPNGRNLGVSGWMGYGRRADGIEILVGEYELDDGVARTYAVIVDGAHVSVAYGGKSSATAVLPVQVRLPDSLGWVLMCRGAVLAWRPVSPTIGQPVGSRREAALVPAGVALHVVVTPVGSESRQLTLPAA